MKTILVVDDEIDVRNLLEATLARGGYEILQASTGQEALEVSRDKMPDLILMDVLMPGDINGIEATRLLKTDPKTKESKIIVLTSSGAAREDALNAGADVYLEKPFSPLELLQKMDELIELKSLDEYFDKAGRNSL